MEEQEDPRDTRLMSKILNNHVLAADVGGTNTRMAIVTGNGEILTFLKKSTHCKEGRDEMIKFLVSFARETIEKSKLPKRKKYMRDGDWFSRAVKCRDGYNLQSS